MSAKDSGVKIIPTGCLHDCGGRCLLRAHVKDGKIIRFETDDGEEPQIRACAKGRASRQRIYHPDRLKYPMKRVGEKGEGKFERISWDEALDTVANRLKMVKETYGNESIMLSWGSGFNNAELSSRFVMQRLLFMFGGATPLWGGRSAQGGVSANRVTYGTMDTGHTRDDLVNSKLIIMWGWSPVETQQVTNTPYYVTLAKEAGAKIYFVDPRFSNSGALWADEWIPIKPTTDAAMLAAMAYVIITENLQDQKFLDTYTVGFDKFKDYILGKEDGVPKTPAWAEAITAVPAGTIQKLAREYATTRPAALIPGYAAGRNAYGEQYHRFTAALAAMTGNVGKSGGGAGGFERVPAYYKRKKGLPYAISFVFSSFPVPPNPLEKDKDPGPLGSMDLTERLKYRVETAKIWDALIKGKAGGYPADFKIYYLLGGDPLVTHQNTNLGVQALKSVEFTVIHEYFMTPTAKFADILLPVNSCVERNELFRPWGAAPYVVFNNKVIESQYETRSDWDIACALAQRLGIKDYDMGMNEEQWLKYLFNLRKDLTNNIPDYDEFRRKGYYKIKYPKPIVAFKEQIEDPANNPFPTPSGKIEIYSEHIGLLKDPNFPTIPKYIPAWEGPADPLIKKFPLQIISPHPMRSAHSAHDLIPWLRELEPPAMWISPPDAEARGIKDGDRVEIFNDRGRVRVPAKVTPRIIPGVVSLHEGVYYEPDKDGVDLGGNVNVLTKDEYSAGAAWCANTLVQVKKV